MYEHRRYGDSSPFAVVDIRVTRTQDVLWLDLALIALASTGVLAIAKGLQEFSVRKVLYSITEEGICLEDQQVCQDRYREYKYYHHICDMC